MLEAAEALVPAAPPGPALMHTKFQLWGSGIKNPES